MQRILTRQTDNEKAPVLPHIYNLRRVNSDPAVTQSGSATGERISIMVRNVLDYWLHSNLQRILKCCRSTTSSMMTIIMMIEVRIFFERNKVIFL